MTHEWLQRFLALGIIEVPVPLFDRTNRSSPAEEEMCRACGFKASMREEAMTRTTNQEEMWRALFQEEESRLSVAAEVLLQRNVFPDQILGTALEELKGSPFHEAFGRSSALRAVVKAAIAYNKTVVDHDSAATSPLPLKDGCESAPFLASLPWAERAAFFLREVLNYSCRDTALLLGMSDANVDRLCRLAARRIESPDQTDISSKALHTSAA